MSADLIARGLASKARGDAAAAASAAALAQSSANSALAGANAKSANTAALIAAIRNNGFFPQPVTRATAADVPVVTLGAAGAASTINSQGSGGATVPRFDSRISYVAGPLKAAGSGYPLSGYAMSRGAYQGASNGAGDPYYSTLFHGLEFTHNGDRFEIPVTGHGSAGLNFRLYVDDVLVTATSTPYGTGNLHFVKFVFGSVRARRIRVETGGVPTNGVNAAVSGDVAATGRSYPLVTVIGDSLVEGTGADGGPGSEGAVLARALGCKVSVAGVGGTGLLNPGGNNTAGFPRVPFTHATRMQDLTLAGTVDAQGSSVTPALGVVCMSFNDPGTAAIWNGAANSFEAVKNAVFTLIDAWSAANPQKPLVFFGPTWTDETPILELYRVRDAGQEACWAAQRYNVWFVDRMGPGTLLRKGAKASLSTTGITTNGNAQVTGLASTTGVVLGAGVFGTGIPVGATVVSINSTTSVTLSHAATASNAGVALTFKNDHAAHYTNIQAGDPTHPDQAGHNLDGLWMAARLRDLIFNAFV